MYRVILLNNDGTMKHDVPENICIEELLDMLDSGELKSFTITLA